MNLKRSCTARWLDARSPLRAGATVYRHEAAYLRERNPRAAAEFLKRMATAFNDLGTFSAAGFDGKGLPVPGLRRLLRGGYFIDYTIENGVLVIVGISNSVNRPLSLPSDDPDYQG